MGTADEITLGEVWRAQQRVEASLERLESALSDVRTQVAVTQEKTGRLERVVYGAAATAGAALATAVATAVVATWKG